MPAERELILDGLAFVPRHALFPVERVTCLAEVAAARKAAQSRISWAVIFLKAYAGVCAQIPALRRAYQPWPWPHLLESGQVVGQLVVNRKSTAGELLCWARFIEPERQPLETLQRRLDEYQTAPLQSVFRKQLTLAKLPGPLRRLLWWWQLNFSGSKRATRLGTFTQSSLAGQGCVNRFHQTLLTTSLSYGPIDERGCAAVTLICDHRVLDGMQAARALGELEAFLQTEILAELRQLAGARRAA
jgi:hypothetical protein